MLQPGLVLEEILHTDLNDIETLQPSSLPVEEVDALLDLADLLHQPVVGRVPAQLHVRPVGPVFNN